QRIEKDRFFKLLDRETIILQSNQGITQENQNHHILKFLYQDFLRDLGNQTKIPTIYKSCNQIDRTQLKINFDILQKILQKNNKLLCYNVEILLLDIIQNKKIPHVAISRILLDSV